MLGRTFNKPKKSEDQIKQERNKLLNEMLDKSVKLKTMINSNQSGWQEFILLIDEYIDKCKKRKAITALDMATDADLYQLKLLDHEVFILSWIKQMPEQFINNIDNKVKQNQRE